MKGLWWVGKRNYLRGEVRFSGFINVTFCKFTVNCDFKKKEEEKKTHKILPTVKGGFIYGREGGSQREERNLFNRSNKDKNITERRKDLIN